LLPVFPLHIASSGFIAAFSTAAAQLLFRGCAFILRRPVSLPEYGHHTAARRMWAFRRAHETTAQGIAC